MSILSKQSVQKSAAEYSESCLSGDRAVSNVATDNSAQTSLDLATEHQAIAFDDRMSDKSVAVQVNEMPANIAIKHPVALTNTAPSSSGQTSEQQQQSLQLLSSQPLLYSGNLAAAAQMITATTAAMLGTARVSLWQLADGNLMSVDRYDRRQNEHTQGAALSAETCGAYLQSIEVNSAVDCSSSATGSSSGTKSRADLAVENVAQAFSSQTFPALHQMAKDAVIFCSPGAFLEIAIRSKGEVVGFLWCEHAQAHRWTTLEKTVALSVALLAAAAMGSVEQTAMGAVLDKQHKQLKRETIEREQAEQAWQESQRFIQGIIDASTNILYVDNFVDGSNIYISRWIMNVLGYEAYEVQKLGPQYLEKLVHADEKALMMTERKKLSAINDGEVVENEYRFRHRQGNWRWLLCRETVFQRDKDGQPTQVFGTATDITKRKHAEVALKEFNRELERLASMDGLTQVANRRSFDSYLAQEWQNVGLGRSSLSLILCDIDYFKSFNDTYGHQAGDVCLRRVAQAIERAVKRSTDLVARYGGEEFAVVLPNTSSEGVEQVAKEIQKEIQQLDIPHSQSEVSKCITLSLGIAVVSSTESRHPGMLVAAADQGLYQAKYEGRDRYCLGELDMSSSPQV